LAQLLKSEQFIMALAQDKCVKAYTFYAPQYQEQQP